MASKSKRRRRVLGASCILAALIIAASSFAWFTSKDEVTNRLTANADYGVSIVESFAPPANWLPGQTVNKDVYAVNTGNVDAFVKETVSGVLDYTFEKKVNTFDAAKCLKLTSAQVTTIDGVTTNEGGGFLAWTDAQGVNVGAVNSARIADNIGDTWHPTVRGTYIFRRSINTNNTSTPNPTFTYAGYYFDGTDYYKIVIGGDDYRATETTGTAGNANKVDFDIYASETALGNSVDINRTDGTFTGSPKIAYVENDTQKANVTFRYDANNGKPRLVVQYSADAPKQRVNIGTEQAPNYVEYDASAWSARKEVEYWNAVGELNNATVAYEQAKADNDYALALAKARDTLQTAAQTRLDAYNAVNNNTNGTQTLLNQAWSDLINESKKLINDNDNNDATVSYREQLAIMTGLKVNDLFSTEVQNRINSDTATPTLTECQENLATMNALWAEMADPTTGLDKQIWDAIKPIATADVNAVDSAKLTPSEVQGHVDNTKRKLNQIIAKCRAYADAYSAITSDPTTATLLGLDETAAGQNKANILSVANNVESLVNELDNEVSAYRTAYNNQQTKTTADTDAQLVWVEAINNYNNSVNAAKTAYENVVGTTSNPKAGPTPQPGNTATYTNYVNHSATIVPEYSMQRDANASDPALTTAQINDAKVYGTGYDQIVSKTFPSGATATNPTIKEQTDKVNTNEADLLSTLNSKKSAAETARQAYEDAKAESDGSSTITMYVNLAADYATNWTMNQFTDGTQNVEFYLKKVLEGGETSKKLIDSVEFANTVEAKDFKNLTFDLNVGLRSAQVTFDEKGVMTSDAVLSPDFNMSVQTIATDGSKAVTWSDVAPPAAPAPTP